MRPSSALRVWNILGHSAPPLGAPVRRAPRKIWNATQPSPSRPRLWLGQDDLWRVHRAPEVTPLPSSPHRSAPEHGAEEDASRGVGDTRFVLLFSCSGRFSSCLAVEGTAGWGPHSGSRGAFWDQPANCELSPRPQAGTGSGHRGLGGAVLLLCGDRHPHRWGQESAGRAQLGQKPAGPPLVVMETLYPKRSFSCKCKQFPKRF